MDINTGHKLQGVSVKKTLINYQKAILILVLILIAISLPGNALKNTKVLIIPYFDKIVHFSMFGALSFFLNNGFYKSISRKYNPLKEVKYLIIILSISGIYAAITEMLQKYFVPGRSAEMLDFIADIIGAFAGLLLYNIVFKRPWKLIQLLIK